MPPEAENGAIDASVIVTAYNQAEVLGITLRSLAMQDFKGSWELILCDDGSSESLAHTIEGSGLTSKVAVRYIWQCRQGERRAKSRNNGLQCASGRTVIFLDGDLLVPNTFITQHLAFHSDRKQLAVYGTRRWLFMNDLPAGMCAASIAEPLFADVSNSVCLFSEESFQQKYSRSDHPWRGCMGCNFSFSAATRPILFDESFTGWGNEDIEFAYRLQRECGYELQFAPSIFGLHLEYRSRKDLSVLRPVAPDQIASFVRSTLHLHELHPEIDVAVSCELLGHYDYDPDLSMWKVATVPCFERDHIDYLLGIAKRWTLEKSKNLGSPHNNID